MRALAAALIMVAGAPAARANENLKCFGTESFFGSLAGLADGKAGPLALQKYSTTLPNGSFEENGEPGMESQKLSSLMKNQATPKRMAA